MLTEILEHNRDFVTNKDYEPYATSKFPDRKLAIVTCMDTRLIELLPAALGLKNGDVKMIKNAGGVISHPFGSVMRSLIIGIYDIGIEEILVIGHTDCGARCTNSDNIIEKIKARGITQESIDLMNYCGIDFPSWIGGFQDLSLSIKNSVDIIRNHPFITDEIQIHGLIINSETGELTKVC